jgi:hypothetical protein
MFQRMIDDFKERTGTALRLTSLAGVAALALLVAISFLCAAAFVYVMQNYGPVQACLTGAAVFLVVTLIAAGCYMVRKNSAKARAAEAAKSAARSPFADPVLIAAGLQLIRAVGVKRLIPLLAVGGLALGILASRSASSDDTPET